MRKVIGIQLALVIISICYLKGWSLEGLLLIDISYFASETESKKKKKMKIKKKKERKRRIPDQRSKGSKKGKEAILDQ